MTSSLFYYPQGTDYNTFNILDFTPLFYEEVVGNMTPEQKADAEKTCGTNKECIFDLAITGECHVSCLLLWKSHTYAHPHAFTHAYAHTRMHVYVHMHTQTHI